MKVRVVRTVANDFPQLLLKGSNFQQVIINLAVNAVDAMSGGPDDCLQFSAFRSDDGFVIQVSDTGSGISPEHLSRIFDPFFTTKPPGKGTGLGLSVCRSIVEDHGGSIQCASRPGKGALFTIQLPAEIAGHSKQKGRLENKSAVFSALAANKE